MGHIQKRENGRWRARYRGPDGREYSKTFDRKGEAEQFLAWVAVDQSRGRWVDPRHGKATFGEWVAGWQATTVDLAESTRVRTDGIVRNYLLPRFRHREISGIQHLEVKAWVAELSASGLAPRTVRKIGQVLGQVMAAAVDAGMIANDPTARVKLPDGSTHEPMFVTARQVVDLVDAIGERYRALIMVAGFGGLRFSELAGLRRRRVDTLRGRLEVTEAAVEAGGRMHHKTPKSRAGRRTVPLPPTAMHALTSHLELHTGGEADALVFTSPKGEVLRARTFRSRYFDPAVRAVGLDGLTPHDLRHTAISLWILAGTDVKTVSTRAGHSSTSFTRYGHSYDGADAQSIARLDALIGDASPAPAADVRRLRP